MSPPVNFAASATFVSLARRPRACPLDRFCNTCRTSIRRPHHRREKRRGRQKRPPVTLRVRSAVLSGGSSGNGCVHGHSRRDAGAHTDAGAPDSTHDVGAQTDGDAPHAPHDGIGRGSQPSGFGHAANGTPGGSGSPSRVWRSHPPRPTPTGPPLDLVESLAWESLLCGALRPDDGGDREWQRVLLQVRSAKESSNPGRHSTRGSANEVPERAKHLLVRAHVCHVLW